MNWITRTIWLFALASFLGGCSSYRMMAPSRWDAEPEGAGGAVYELDRGDRVRVVTLDGGSAEGRVLAAAPGSISLLVDKCSDHFAAGGRGDTVTLPMDAVTSLEKRRFDVAETVGLVCAIALPIVVIGAGFESVDMSMDSGNWESPFPY